MSTSCFNEELIFRAHANSAVNASLLLDALSVLCPKQDAVDQFAEKPYTIVLAYFFGFLLWGFLVLFDFISGKWKTVRDTRRSGHYHLAGSVIPVPV